MCVRDPDLDPVQRDAVARAVNSPDVFVLRGLPGTGKSRVVVEIVGQATARGERVLLVGLTAAGLDGVLDAVAGQDGVFALRCVAPEEDSDMLPALSRSLTLGERLRALTQAALEQSRQRLAACEQRLARIQQDISLWPRLEEIAQEQASLEQQLEQLRLDRAAIPDTVKREAAAAEPTACDTADTRFSCTMASAQALFNERQATLEADLAVARRHIVERQQDQTRAAEGTEALRPLVEAKERRRWWSAAWWRALAHKNLRKKWTGLQDEGCRLQEAVAALEDEVQHLLQKQECALAAHQAACAELIQTETSWRLAERESQERRLQQRQAEVQTEWQGLCTALASETYKPSACAPGSLKAAYALWQQHLAQAEKEISFCGHWLACLEETPSWHDHVPRLANLVAATPAGLAGDAQFGDSAPNRERFDLLVLLNADQVPEPELHKTAARARRWVLVGEPPPMPATSARAQAISSERADGNCAQLFGESVTFHRLWQIWHCDPRRSPCAWTREQARLCCHLRTIEPDQRARLEYERLADYPDIELRILSLPRLPPCLAEVVFPASFSLAQAKAFIFRELQELAIQTAASTFTWSDETDRIVLRLAAPGEAALVPIALEHGVREFVRASLAEVNGKLAPHPGLTHSLEFARDAGWDRTRAEQWLRRHWVLQDPGRTAQLDVPYRMHPDLAAFLSHCLFAGAYRPRADWAESPALPSGTNGRHAPVEFICVPPLNDRKESLKAKNRVPSVRVSVPPIPHKGGAGLELNLAERRHRERLPPELERGLPEVGFVNLGEAQAVVRYLERLLTDRALAALAQEPAASAPKPLVGIVALYPAQVELIRRLLGRTALLQAAAVAIDVGLPGAFRDRECAVILLSLTRSHVHRAVTFGDKPEMLTLALTRARSKVVIFGDPGSLARRSHWDGPLDHLDTVAATRERDFALHLVDYLQGRGRHAAAFQLREGADA
jgi:hypothetical protein